MTANQEVALLNNKIRVHELAKQLNSTSKKVLEKLNEIGIKDKSYMSILDEDELRRFYEQTGVKASKKADASADDSAAKKVSVQKEQQTQSKSSGVIVRRIIVDNSSSDYSADSKGSDSQKFRKQSREAGSGLRSGYAVRNEAAEDSYTSDKKETKETDEKVQTQVTQPAKTEPTVRRVKRVKKEDK